MKPRIRSKKQKRRRRKLVIYCDGSSRLCTAADTAEKAVGDARRYAPKLWL